MPWFYLFIVILSLCLKTTILANSSSIGNQLAAAAPDGNIGAINDKSCFHKETQALLDFKASLEDPYGQLSTWRPENVDCCKWSGITCNNQTGHVTELNLRFDYAGELDLIMGIGFDGLRGEISPSLVNLTYLNHLDLFYNSFHGTIPSFIGSMTQLRYLDLSENDFNGTIPNFIGSMTQLRHLDLNYNSFEGTIPSEFGNLTNLRNLSLGTIEMSCTVQNLDWLSNLSHLQHLDMFGISLAKANHWIDVVLSLPKLSDVSLVGCDLSKVMHPYSSFLNSSSSSSIESLYLEFNNLNSSMYRWLFPLTSNRLVSLGLSRNMLDGIPRYLGNLCSLTSLYFTHNSAVVKFTEFLNNLSGCTSNTLQELDVSGSQFTGSLSDDIHKFSSLQSLDLSHNHLNGSMSEKVWELPNLQTLDVSSNSLIISPNNIGRSKLRYIDLSNTSLEGVPSIAHMPNLSYVEHIDLNRPLFPTWIQTLKNLTRLNIADNRISDTIPLEFWNTSPSRLSYLNLSYNNISGKVPDLSSNFDLYPRIDLSSNNFYGPIPNVPSTLVFLNLSRNKFYGGISFLCQIVDGFLSFLDLSYNSLTGPLPDCLWHFKELEVLNLGYNKLSGRLPASIGYLVRLEVLDLSKNSFSGELPLALKNCTRLKFLNMGANRLFGNVPVWIGENLTKLYGLILRSNNFFGPIPLQLCYFMDLQILDLSINNLNGTIPSCVNNLYAMVHERLLSQQNIHYPLVYNQNVTTLDLGFKYVDKAMIEWQGNEREFTSNMGLLMVIDLSSNKLTGQIPNELVDLHELLVLNLSNNALLGLIPRKIGEMKNLLTLDLSRNQFSGGIPSRMSEMASLNYLDISHNSLSGRIPSSTQLQSFPPSWYSGNAGLCGPPISKNCPIHEVAHGTSKSERGEEGADELQRWFYIGGSIGFATGFWMACGALLLNRHGRHAFFRAVDFMKDWVYVKVVVFFRKLQRVQHA